MTLIRALFVAIVVCSVSVLPVSAQDSEPAHHQHETPADHWTWATDANVFVGFNDQQREFADVTAWESQNWFMGSAARPVGAGRLTISSMASLEAFTLHPHGSPQLFQTGESYQHAPLLNYQHPHDLVMELGATYQRSVGAGSYYVGADLVGSPTLGPTPFMHRESARSNPQVPLTHHYLDATHISAGVVAGGVTFGDFTFESSAFRGEEPDEDRLNIERPRLDSYAARIQFNRGPWHAQLSGGHLHEPEWFDPLNVNLFTASIAFDGHVGGRPLDMTLAWGGHREFNGFNGDADGFLTEAQFSLSARSTIYGRAEYTGKDLFVDVHPRGFTHRSVIYEVGAFTAGYVRDVSVTRAGRFGIGADATLYHMQDDLLIFWSGSKSFHVFLRWRPGGGAMSDMHM